jgi:hypothetical protein
MALEGWISHEEFFNPDNLQRILEKAGSRTVALEHPVAAYLPCRTNYELTQEKDGETNIALDARD